MWRVKLTQETKVPWKGINLIGTQVKVVKHRATSKTSGNGGDLVTPVTKKQFELSRRTVKKVGGG